MFQVVARYLNSSPHLYYGRTSSPHLYYGRTSSPHLYYGRTSWKKLKEKLKTGAACLWTTNTFLVDGAASTEYKL